MLTVVKLRQHILGLTLNLTPPRTRPFIVLYACVVATTVVARRL